jgi:hypothetical protein
MLKRPSCTDKGPRPSITQAVSHPGGGVCFPSGHQSSLRGYAARFLSLVVGLCSLAIIFGVAVSFREQAVGTWPQTGLVVVTTVAETTQHQAGGAPLVRTRSEARESDLSVATVRTMLSHRNAVEHNTPTHAGFADVVSWDPHDAKWHYSPNVYHPTR